jgi:hypothetical protein
VLSKNLSGSNYIEKSERTFVYGFYHQLLRLNRDLAPDLKSLRWEIASIKAMAQLKDGKDISFHNCGIRVARMNLGEN